MARRRTSLVCQYLENLSSAAFERYADVLREVTHGRHGVYALYRRDKLYYVGLAKNLRNRVRHHNRDRHKGLWDRFSMYLTIDDKHLKELESLVLRIAQPKGNKQRGGFARSENLIKVLRRKVKEAHQNEWLELIGRTPQSARPERVVTDGKARFVGLVARATPMRRRYKGKLYRASLRPNGKVRVGKTVYESPTEAASAIAGRGCNGWYFWNFQRAPGQWVKIRVLKR